MVPYERIHSWRNLLRSSEQARRGRRGAPSIAAHEYRLEEELLELQHELQTETYRPGLYHSFVVHDPKRRLISAAPVRDRVVHHALCNLLEPVFERTFIAESFANRPGCGTHAALDHCQRLARRHRFALPCDMRQFFPSIDHQILKRTLFRRISDCRTRRLIELILASGAGVLASEYDMVWFPGDDLFAICRPRGLPIGNLTSQIWANCHLNPLDHFVKRELRCAGYVRYVDDFSLFADSKAALWEWKAAILDRLTRMRLTIHAGAHPRPVTEGLPFLGFTVYPERRRLKRRNAAHFARRLRGLLGAQQRGEIDAARVESSIRGWVAHASHGNTVGLQKSILERHGLRRDDFVSQPEAQ